MTFLEQLKVEQEKRGLSKASFGELIGVSARTLWNWENGNSEPSERKGKDVIEKLSKEPVKVEDVDREGLINEMFLDTEDTIRSLDTCFCATCTKRFAFLLDGLRDAVVGGDSVDESFKATEGIAGNFNDCCEKCVKGFIYLLGKLKEKVVK